jgi:hypothetical protein
MHSATLFAQNPSFVLGDNHEKTGPLQKIKVNVSKTDIIPCSDYVMSIISNLDPITQGIATALPGGFIEFMPGVNAPGTTVNIVYSITCDVLTEQATLFVEVTQFNNPTNVISP